MPEGRLGTSATTSELPSRSRVMILRACMSENHSLLSLQRGPSKKAPPSNSTLVVTGRHARFPQQRPPPRSDQSNDQVLPFSASQSSTLIATCEVLGKGKDTLRIESVRFDLVPHMPQDSTNTTGPGW